jgi:hypothetical protein
MAGEKARNGVRVGAARGQLRQLSAQELEQLLGRTPWCTSGFPFELANRTMVGTDCPAKWGARVTRRASAEARNAPVQTRPSA